MDYTEEQYLAEKKTAKELAFKENMLDVTSYDVAAKVCNGIGASWFPEKLRKAVSKLNPSLVVVANNHDLGYYYGTGTMSHFNRVNQAFRANGEKIAKAKYGWYDPRRYWVMWKAAKFTALCEVCGWVAYETAINERKEAEKAEKAENKA